MKKTFLLVLVCFIVCFAGVLKAELGITNGDFEANTEYDEDGLVVAADIWDFEVNKVGWYIHSYSWYNAWVKIAGSSYNEGGVLVLSGEADNINTNPDPGDLGTDLQNNWAYQSIGTKEAGDTVIQIAFDWARLTDQGADPLEIGLTFTILESNGTFTPENGAALDIFGASGVTVVDQVTKTSVLTTGDPGQEEVWQFDLSSAGSGELFLRIHQYELTIDSWNFIGVDNIRILTVENNSPADGGVDVPEGEGEINVEPENSSNDLSFTVSDPRIVSVDVQLAPYPDPNLSWAEYSLVQDMAVTNGEQYTVDLESELSANLEYDTVYYWKVIAYDASSNVISPTPVSSFRTVPEHPVIGDVVPEVGVAEAGSPVVFGLSRAINIANFQWYKVGETEPLVDGAEYSGVTTDTLTILDMQLADEGVFYCVGSNTVGSVSNEETGSGHAMVARLVSYYPIESVSEGATPDTVDGWDMALMSDDEAAIGLPVLDTDVVDVELGASSMSFVNPSENDPNGVYGQIPAGAVNYGDMTISCWAKWSGSSAFQRIWDFGNDDTHYVFLTPSDGNTVRFVIRNGGDEQIVDSTFAMVQDEWTYIAVTLSGDTAKLYVNGEMLGINEETTIDPIDVDPELNYFAKSQFAVDPYFEGKIDEVKIYNYALTTEEVAQDYMNIAGGWVCDYDQESLPYDYNGNCVIDLPDFAIFAATWMDSHRIYDDNN